MIRNCIIGLCIALVCLSLTLLHAQQYQSTIDLPLPSGATIVVPGYMEIAPARNRIYVVAGVGPAFTTSVVYVIDGSTDSVAATIPIEKEAFDLVYNPVNDRLYVGTFQGGIKVIDPSTNSIAQVISSISEASYLAVNPITNKVYASSFRSPQIHIIDGNTNTPIGTISLPTDSNFPGPLKINPATNRIYMTYGSGSIYPLVIIDGNTNTVLNRDFTTTFGKLEIDLTNNKLYAGGAGTGGFSVLDLATDTLLAVNLPLASSHQSSGIAYNATSNHLHFTEIVNGSAPLISVNPATHAVVSTLNIPGAETIFDVESNPYTSKLYVNQRDTFSGHNTPGKVYVLLDPCTDTSCDPCPSDPSNDEDGDGVCGHPPVVNAGPDASSQMEGSSVSFSGSVTDADFLDTHTYEWNFGDGSIFTGLTATHVYADNGVYTATLSATDSFGATRSDTRQVSVINANPVLASLPPRTVTVADSVDLTATFTDEGRDTHVGQVDWNGDGSLETTMSVGETPGLPTSGVLTSSHVYTRGGNFTISVRVTDDDLGFDTKTFAITVLAPDADNDTVPDVYDNCVNTYNPQQENLDQDSEGNACDTDDDNDGRLDAADNCPLAPNPNQEDTDQDGRGDACAPPTQQWVAKYNGPANRSDLSAEYRAIAVDALGNSFVTGYSYDGTSYDIMTMKYDGSGNQVWAQSYGTPGTFERANAIALDSNGNVYVTGSTYNGSNQDFTTIKYDSAGTLLWSRTFNGVSNHDDWSTSIGTDTNGNVYVGASSINGSNNSDRAIVKYDTNGNQLWVSIYNGTDNGNDSITAMVIDAGGNVYATGVSQSSGGYYDYATAKYDTNGNQLWVSFYNGPANNYDEATAITVDANGYVYVTGNSNGINTGLDYTTIKYAPNGAELWVQRYNAANMSDYAKAICVDPSGNIYVTGTAYDATVSRTCYSCGWYSCSSYSCPYNTADIRTIRISPSGALQLWYNFGFSYYDDSASALSCDSAGNAYVTGTASGYTGTAPDFVTLKYGQNGVASSWNNVGFGTGVRIYNGPENSSDQAKSIAVDSSGNAYVTGISYNAASEYDFATIKYLGSPQNCTQPGSVAHWSAEGNANDSNLSSPGFPSGGISYTAGQIGDGFDLNGSSAFVKIDSSILYPANGSMTLSAWVKSTGITGEQTIFSRDECSFSCPTGANSMYSLIIDTNGYLSGSVRDSGSVLTQTTGSTMIRDGFLHHVIMVRDVAAMRLRLYVDGTLNAEVPLNSVGSIQNDDGFADPLLIGGSLAGGIGNFFQGVIDEAFYYNRALSASEIVTFYNCQKTVDPPVSITSQPGSDPVTVSTAPQEPTEAGATATLTNNTPGSPTATVTVQNLSTNPEGFQLAQGVYVDVKATGVDSSDTLVVNFYYPLTVDENTLLLRYFNAAANRYDPVRSSGNSTPVKNTTDHLDGTVSGGRFTVIFSSTSIPKITQLTGTVFAMAVEAPMDLSLTSSLNPSKLGEAVTLVATLSGDAAPSQVGTISFRDNGQEFGSSEIINGSTALTMIDLPVGAHSLTAVYVDNQSNESTSSVLSQTVQKGSSVTSVQFLGNSSMLGQTVSFTATVEFPLVDTNILVPGGTVVFKDNGIQIGSASLQKVDQAFNALFTHTFSTVGNHSIVAVYSGDNNFDSSSSPALAQNVTYSFSGFFSPVDNTPIFNKLKAGSAVPVKFSLNGDYGLNILAGNSPSSQQINCGTSSVDEIEQTVTASSSSLKYDSATGQYIYVWKTDKSWVGKCRQLIVTLNDTTQHIAFFTFN